jgi:hypothetical protein
MATHGFHDDISGIGLPPEQAIVLCFREYCEELQQERKKNGK